MILCRNLTRRFGEFTAVDNLNFEVAAGAICAFLGPNGAGKSTTVKMLTGLLAPTSGSVEVCGINAQADPLELKRRIGVLPEDLGEAVVLLHSARAAQRVAALASDRAGLILAAISAPVAAAAGDGWRHVAIADAPRDEALLELAAKLCQNKDVARRR